MSQDVQQAQQALDAAKASHRNDPDQIMGRLKADLAAAAPKMHTGGEVPEDGVYELQAGEHVLTEDQENKIAPTVPENNLAAAFAKIGGKFVGTVGGKTPAQANAGAPSEEIPSGSPWHDAASPILRAATGITDADREQLWDAFAQSKDHNELAEKLTPMNVPDSVKHSLFMAKAAAQPEQSHADKMVGI